jgi:fumarate hydratase, class II
MSMKKYRVERDTMGQVKVPLNALYMAQTQRALENFPVSGLKFGRSFIQSLGLIKGAAASVNQELQILDRRVAKAIRLAAKEVANGRHDEHFPVDIFQSGSGTSTNMNANEVIARRARQIDRGVLVHPNDHVNLGQSSNDVIPSAIHIAALLTSHEKLLPALEHLRLVLLRKARENTLVIKTGRTHLMDAMPVRLSQEFEGWAAQIANGMERIKVTFPRMRELALGGTAVGTGINTHAEFGKRVAATLSELTGFTFVEARNHFEAQSSQDAVVELSGQLRTVSISLIKICNDLRWMNSGPNAGLSEIQLPVLQPGSSIMPGKVNPVIPEAVLMVTAQVIGNDATIAFSASQGNFELLTMMPVIAYNLLQSLDILSNGTRLLADKAVSGCSVNHERISQVLEANPMLATALSPVIGYELSAEIAKEAAARGRPVKEIAVEKTHLPKKELDRLLDPKNLTSGGLEGVRPARKSGKNRKPAKPTS